VKLSIVFPVYNEAETLPLLFSALRPVLASLDCDYELIFVNDGSRDASFAILAREAALDPRVKVLAFSRNFGHQTAVTAGIDFSTGDAIVIMDADLQDPPQLLFEMVRLYREGYDVVSPQRIRREGDSWFKRKTASLFYGFMRKMVDERIRPEVGDFRLLSRHAADALRAFREQHRFMRGLVSWLGLKEAVLPFERQARAAGETKYPLSKMIRFSWTAICSFSALPLRFTMALGLIACGGSFSYLLYAAYVALIRKAVVPGWTSIVFLQCFFFGVTLICLGLIGEYTARIYDESKRRPLYVIDQALNISGQPPDLGRVVFLRRENAASLMTAPWR
jgi:glycosyltransferase involved in cell wall biosynthesis